MNVSPRKILGQFCVFALLLMGAFNAYAQTPTYTVGGSITGLATGKTVVLKNNTSTVLVSSTSSSFTFPAQSAGTSWNVSVAIQPSGQTCTVTNPSGTNISAIVTNVSVVCANTYTVGGTVTGLTSGSVVLRMGTISLVVNSVTGSSSSSVSSGSSSSSSSVIPFKFAKGLTNGTVYQVFVAIQPSGFICTPPNITGVINGANVTNVLFACQKTYTVGGTIVGLTGTGLTLKLNYGINLEKSLSKAVQPSLYGETLPLNFAAGIKSGEQYKVTITTQPAGQVCRVINGEGTITGSNINNVLVQCGYTFTISRNGTGAGTVTSSPAGINCGTTCTANFDHGSTVTLTATADANSEFAGWNYSPCSSTGNTCTISLLRANKNITAFFNIKRYAVTVTQGTGNSTGNVISAPTGINCGTICSANFIQGTTVTLIASPAENSEVVWSGADASNCSGNTCTFSSLAAAKSVMATFNLSGHTVGGIVSYLAPGQQLKLALTNPPQAAVSVSSGGSTFDSSGESFTVGWGFGLSGNKVLTHLGAWTGGGVSGDIAIGLWNATGSLLATTTLLSSNIASYPVDGDFQYAQLSSSVSLSSGQYTVGAFYVGGVLASFGAPVTPINGLTFLTPSLVDFGTALANPTIDSSESLPNGIFGPNLRLSDIPSEEITITSNGSFNFATRLNDQTNYLVTVSAQPTSQICSVQNGSGTMAGTDVTSVQVNCINKYTIGGKIISELPDLNGLVLSLFANGTPSTQTFTANSAGGWNFAEGYVSGTSYSVRIQTQPTGQFCRLYELSDTDLTFTPLTGVVGEGNTTNITVWCSTDIFNYVANISGASVEVTGSSYPEENKTYTATRFKVRLKYGDSIRLTPTLDGFFCFVTNPSGPTAGLPIGNGSPILYIDKSIAINCSLTKPTFNVMVTNNSGGPVTASGSSVSGANRTYEGASFQVAVTLDDPLVLTPTLISNQFCNVVSTTAVTNIYYLPVIQPCSASGIVNVANAGRPKPLTITGSTAGCVITDDSSTSIPVCVNYGDVLTIRTKPILTNQICGEFTAKVTSLSTIQALGCRKLRTITITNSPSPAMVSISGIPTYTEYTDADAMLHEFSNAQSNAATVVFLVGDSYSPVVSAVDANGQSCMITPSIPSPILSDVTATVECKDVTPPDAPTLSLVADTGWANNDMITNNQTVNVSNLETGATWQYRVDGGLWVLGAGTSFNLTVGAHTYEVRQIDLAWNFSSISSLTATLDTVAPVAPVVVLASDTGSSSSDNITSVSMVNVSGIEAGATWQYQVDGGGTWQAGVGTTFQLAEGAHVYKVRQTDVAGNLSLYSPLSATLATDSYSITVPVTGNVDTITVTNNALDPQALVADTGSGGVATFAGLVGGSAYLIEATQPLGQVCLVFNGSGTVAGNVTSVSVICTSNPYTLGVSLNKPPIPTAGTGSYLTIQDQAGHERVMVYGTVSPAGFGQPTFGIPAVWAPQLPVTVNSLVVYAGGLYVVDYGQSAIHQCTVGTTAPTAAVGTTAQGTVQVIAASEQPTTPVGTSLSPCTVNVTLTYVGPYSGETAATYTPYTYTVGQSYSLTITSDPFNGTCKLNGTNGVGVPYTGTFSASNVLVPVSCEYLSSNISGTITSYGNPSTAIVGGVQIEATATWSQCSTAGTCTLTAVTPTSGGTLNDIKPGYQVWIDGDTKVGAVWLFNGARGLSANTYVSDAYVPGNATVQITTVTTMAQATNQNIVLTSGGVSTYYGMKLTVIGTAVDNTPISYTTDAIAVNATTFTIPTTYLFKAGTAYNVTISTAPKYATGTERTCTLYNGSGTIPTGADSTPVINNLVVDCGLNVENSRLLVGNSTTVQTTAALTTPMAPTLPGGAPYTTVTFPDIKSFNSLYAYSDNYFAYVLNSPASGAGSLAVLQVSASTGVMTQSAATAPAVQTLTLGNNPYGVAVSSGFVCATNTTDNTLTFARANLATGTMTNAVTQAIGTEGAAPRGVAMHPSQGFVYVVASGSNAVYQFTSSTMRSLGTTVSTGATPYNIAIDSSGRFAYVTNYGDQTVSMYKICQFTTTNCVRGTLSSLGTVFVPTANPEYIVADASSVLVTTAGGNVYHYAIDSSTGALTQTANSVTVGTPVTGIKLGNARDVFYVTNGGVTPYSYSSSGIGVMGTPLGGVAAAVNLR